MDQESPLVIIADCFMALNESRNTGQNPLDAIRNAANDLDSNLTVVAKRLGARADAQLDIYFSLPQSKGLAAQRQDLEDLVWSLMDVVNAIPDNHSYTVPSSIELGMLKLVAQNIQAAGNARNDLEDESFDVLRRELAQIERDLGDSSLDSDYVAAIRIQIKHLHDELASVPVDPDAVVSKASALIGMLAICARNSTGEQQKKYAGFFQRALTAIGFSGFTGAVAELVSGAMVEAIGSAMEGTTVAPGSSGNETPGYSEI